MMRWMRSLRVAAVWAGAAWIALAVLVRMARGEVVVMSSYAAPVVRIVALVLVFVASCADRLRPGEPQASAEQGGELSPGTGVPAAEVPVVVEPGLPVDRAFPAEVTDEALAVAYGWIPPRSLWGVMTRSGRLGDEGLPVDEPRRTAAKKFAAEVEAFKTRRQKNEDETVATLRSLIVAAEGVPLYDAWLAGFLWGYARTIKPAPVEVLGRLERHLRVAHALTLAQATTGPVEFSAWRSKAGPPPGWRATATVPAGLAKAARREFENGADAGAWETAATLAFKIGAGSVVLVRRGGEMSVAAGAAVRLRRLDVIRAPAGATLAHATLGAIVMAKGGELTAWNVAEFLSVEGRARVQGLVDAALAGDADALTKLEEVLPAAHGVMRAGVEARPDAPGAAGLRTLLTSFDE